MRTEYKDLEHGSTVIVVKNMPEYDFINSWGKTKGKSELKFFTHYKTFPGFPLFVSVHGSVLGWTDSNDRALYYMSFDEFLYKIGYRINDSKVNN